MTIFKSFIPFIMHFFTFSPIKVYYFAPRARAFHNVPYFFGYKTEFFFLPKQSEKSRSFLQDGSRSLGLLRKGKTGIISKFYRTNLVIWSHSKGTKTPSYSRINTVKEDIRAIEKQHFIMMSVSKGILQDIYLADFWHRPLISLYFRCIRTLFLKWLIVSIRIGIWILL